MINICVLYSAVITVGFAGYPSNLSSDVSADCGSLCSKWNSTYTSANCTYTSCSTNSPNPGSYTCDCTVTIACTCANGYTPSVTLPNVVDFPGQCFGGQPDVSGARK